MFNILKMNPVVYGRKLHGVPTAPQCAISTSDVGCLLTGIHCGVQRPKLRDCQNE